MRLAGGFGHGSWKKEKGESKGRKVDGWSERATGWTNPIWVRASLFLLLLLGRHAKEEMEKLGLGHDIEGEGSK